MSSTVTPVKPPRRKTHPDTVLVFAQIMLTLILLLAIIGIVGWLIARKGTLDPGTQSTATNIILVLTTLLTLSWNYFFARQRPNSLPDPNAPPGVTTHAPLSNGGTLTVTGNVTRTPGAPG